ncbi:hypothetical protein [Dongia sp.]|uniref:hypothetical protein n=1 Tax=Dongia sp. TaxID=1977262 RepID=UPI0037520925
MRALGFKKMESKRAERDESEIDKYLRAGREVPRFSGPDMSIPLSLKLLQHHFFASGSFALFKYLIPLAGEVWGQGSLGL